MISLEEWLAEEKANLDRFRADWLRLHAEAPQAYPVEMPEQVDWDEAYMVYLDLDRQGLRPY